jgi:hypothetical protein
MKKILNLFFFGILTINLSAQIDTTEFNRYYSQSSKLEVISKYRELLLDNIVAMDKQKTKELLYYALQQVENENYVVLYPDEKWLICLLIGEYSLITSEMAEMDSAYFEKMKSKVRPRQDDLYKILLQKTNSNRPIIEKDIENTPDLAPDDRAFYKMLLLVYTEPGNLRDYQNILNNQATAFLNDYPGTKHEAYTRNFIRYEFTPKNLRIGCEIYMGYMALSSGLKDYHNGAVNLGLGIIWGWNNFVLNTRYAFGTNKLKKDIQYQDSIWKKGGKATIFLWELSLGYNYRFSEKLTITPVLGCGWFSLSPSTKDAEKNEYLKDINILSYCNPNIGIDLGWKLGDNYFQANNGKLRYNFNSCNLRYVYQPVSFTQKHNQLNGTVHNITLGIKLGFSGAKRVY